MSHLTPSEFDAAIDVTPTAASRDGSRSYDAKLSDDWRIGAATINGGLLISVIAKALRETCAPLGHPDPLTISAYYLSASGAGAATVETSVLRNGRSMTTAQASLSQYDEGGDPVERIRALATYGELAGLPDDVRTTATPPDLPPPEECLGVDLAPGPFKKNAPFLSRLDLRLDPATAGWAIGQPSGQGALQAWLRLPDDREPDPLMLLLAVDALPPVTFDYGLFGWVPTLELTAHVRANPATGWLKVRHSTRNFAGGMLEEDAEVWESAGRLVAQSRQLARAPRPRS